MKLLDKSPEEIVASQQQRLHPLECLTIGEVQYLRWAIGHHGYTASRKKRFAMAEELIGRPFGMPEMQELRQKLGWRELFNPMRAEQEHYMQHGKAIANSSIPLAVKVWRQALKAAEKEMKTGDAMGAARAVPGLVAPALSQVWPKREDGQQQAVVINLTTAQSASLSAPALQVSAEEVIAETIPEDTP